MSQVSLPSQIGATENIIRSRQFSLPAALKRMPTPRSKPSAITYMATATASSPAQISGSQKARPSYSVPKPNMVLPPIRAGCALWPGPPSSPSSGSENGRFGFLPQIVAADVLDRIGPAPQELGEVIGAEAEHEGIDDDEGQERRRHRTGR